MRTLETMMDLTGRVALVTGGAGHIGSHACEALAELGCGLVVLDLPESQPEDTARGLAERFGVSAVGLPVDLEEEVAVRSVPEAIAERFEGLDILINCAALVASRGLTGWSTPFRDQSASSWRRALEVNLTGPFLLTQACEPMLQASGHGSIINISSIYGIVGPDLRIYGSSTMGNPAAYAAGKGGLLTYTKWLATVLAPRIRANAITAGGVFRQQPSEFVSNYCARTPLGRMATEEDFKGAVAYLATDLSAYVTGHNLVVDGGWTAW